MKLVVSPRKQAGLGRSESGNITFLALFMLALLGFIGATVLLNVSRRYNGNEKVQGWQEALYAAEAGADVALTNLTWKVADREANPTPPPAFDIAAGWTTATDADGNVTYTYKTPKTTRQGNEEGTYETWSVVTVDSPPGDNPTGFTLRGNKWYRVRSEGHASLSGLARVSNDTLTDQKGRRQNALRKFNLRYRDNVAVNPEAIRKIEVVVAPRTGFLPGLLADSKLEINGDKVGIIDSFDSDDPSKSKTAPADWDPTVMLPGQYDATKFQQNGTVATNGTDKNALSIKDKVKVYGDAGTNGANFTDPTNAIQAPGQINNAFYSKLDFIQTPNWNLTGAGGVPKMTDLKDLGKSDLTIQVDADSSKNYYTLTKIEKKTTLALKPGVTSGTVYIWLTDKFKDGELVIPKGVTAVMYFSGKTFKPKDDGKRNGIDNQNQNAANFQLYGVSRVKGSQNIKFKLTDTNFYGSVYAPSGNLKLKADSASKAGTYFVGSFVADEIKVEGDVHYDEALNGRGEILDYAKASYVEAR